MARPIRVLELRSVRGTGGGPDKTILNGAARANRTEFAITVCYLRDDRDRIFFIDQRASALSVDYVELRERHSFDTRVWPALRRLVRERAIDIVHSHDYKTDLLAYLLWKFDGIVPLATAHGWAGHSRREGLYYWLDKRLLARLPRTIAVSSDIERELVRHGAGRVALVPNAIDHRAFTRQRTREAAARAALEFPPCDGIVGAIGRLEQEKRFDLLIEAVALLQERNISVGLVIAGEGSQRASLSALADRRQLGSRCHLIGQCADIIGLHHALDVYVQSSSNEGTSNAVLEAMALETPVIATRVGGTTDLVQDGVHGVLVPPGEPAAIADAIAAVLTDREATARRVAAARHRVETELSFDTRMSAVERIYEELLRNRPDAAVSTEAVA